MATSSLLRACSLGSRSILLQMKACPSRVSSSIISKPFTVSPALQYGPLDPFIPDYLRARRGPFTPEEKKGSGHLMDASTHWKVERAVAVGLLGLMPAALFVQGAAVDHLLSTFIYLHGFWGIDGVFQDYLVKFIPWIQKLWWAVAIIGFAGLVNFNFNDIGVTKAIQMFWAI